MSCSTCGRTTGRPFASTYRWDGTGDAIDYVIPDTVQGVKVTAIGGFTGELKKAPTAGLAITMPETYRGAERAHYTMPSGAVEITLPVRIHIGRYVRSVQPDGSLPTPTGYFGYDKGVSSYIITPVWTVTCDEGNETYYARTDGFTSVQTTRWCSCPTLWKEPPDKRREARA